VTRKRSHAARQYKYTARWTSTGLALANDTKKKEEKLSFDDDYDGGSAADDPTAVWDAEALRKAGLDELTKLPEASATPAVTPAATSSGPSIVVEPQAAAPAPAPAPTPDSSNRNTPAPPAPATSMGWATTVALAALLGAIVYGLIRLLR
jgi:hypothetical protein